MDARGLVALIITFHELAAILGVLATGIVFLLGVLLFRNVPSGRRALIIGALSIGAGLFTFAATSRIFHVSTMDIDVVRVDE